MKNKITNYQRIITLLKQKPNIKHNIVEYLDKTKISIVNCCLYYSDFKLVKEIVDDYDLSIVIDLKRNAIILIQ